MSDNSTETPPRLREGMRVLRTSDLQRGEVQSVAIETRDRARGPREIVRVRLESGEAVEAPGRAFDEVLDGGVRLSQVPKFSPWGNNAFDLFLGDIEGQLARLGADREIVLLPDFQRGHVWDDARRSAFVEYILRGGRERRDILFNSPGFGRGLAEPLVLVDGLQRLTAIRRFMAGELPAFGQTLDRFHPEDQHHVRMSSTLTIRFHVNDLPDRAAVLKWYLDLNTGGVVHSDDEIARVRALLEAELAS